MRKRQGEQILLLGDRSMAGRMVNLVRSRAELFERIRTSDGAITHKISFKGGWAIIKLRKGRRKYLIYAEGGGPTYEFFTSALIDGDQQFTPGMGFIVCGRATLSVLGAEITANPLVDLCNEADCLDINTVPEGEKYRKTSCATQQGIFDTKTPVFYNIPKWEPNIWYPNWRGEKFLITGWNSNRYLKGRGLLGMYNVASNFRWSSAKNTWTMLRAGWTYPFVFRFDEDSPYAYGGPNGMQFAMAAASLSTPKGKEILFQVDKDGKWWAWEAGKYDASIQPPLIREVTPSFSSNIGTGWETTRFDSTGKKAVAVVSEFTEGYQVPTSVGGGIYEYQTRYKAVLGSSVGATYGWGDVDASYTGAKEPYRHETPVVVQLEFEVRDDPEVEDLWYFDVTVVAEDAYLDTGDWVIAADYAAPNNGAGLDTNQLVRLKLNVYRLASTVINPPGTPLDSSTALSTWPRFITEGIDASGSFESFNTRTGLWDEFKTIPFIHGSRVDWRVSFFQDPLGNPTEGMNDDIREYGNGSRLYTARLYNLNLSNMSYMYSEAVIERLNSDYIRSYRITSVAFNKTVDVQSIYGPGHDGELETVFDTWPKVPSDGYVPIQKWMIEFYEMYDRSAFRQSYRYQLITHPKGHVAGSTNPWPVPSFQVGGNFGMVDFIQTANGKRTTHQALHNKAFEDARQQSFYNDPVNYGGAFMTCGLFRDK